MTNYVLDGIDLSLLFDSSTSPISFSENPRGYVPDKGSIIYSVWDKDEKFIYIGISGLQKSLEKRSPLSRIVEHASGRRSGDQFCVYIQDYFIIPDLLRKNHPKIQKGSLDKMTKDYIQKHLSYRFVIIKNIKRKELINVEEKIKRGVFGFSPPVLNGVPDSW